MAVFTSEFSSLTDLARQRADTFGERTLYQFLEGGEEPGVNISFASLDRQARAIAAELQQLGLSGRRVLPLFPSGSEFIPAFFGCLYAGVIPAPVMPPRPGEELDRLRAIAGDAEPAAVLTTVGLVDYLRSRCAADPALATLDFITTDDVPERRAEDWSPHVASRDDLAFLQYTSGSTGDPKGVMVTHANLLANSELIRTGFGHDEGSQGVGWLPLYHDMGLIGNVIQPIYAGFPCVHMTPEAFLQRPLRLLSAISRYRASTSGGPNFAYELCLKRIRPADCEGLDLSPWRVAFNGAEPVSSNTIRRFSEVFSRFGFSRDAFYPCYGLAESTLIVTGPRPGEGPVQAGFDSGALAAGDALSAEVGAPRAMTLTSSGRPFAGHVVRIVDPDDKTPCSDGQVGEVWVAGPSVTGGYRERPEESDRVFGGNLVGDSGRQYLRTGDLGFLHEGELYVTGRIKELIIIRGRNLFPHDLERTVERSHALLRPGCSAAYQSSEAGEGILTIVAEVRRDARDADPVEITAAVQVALVSQHGLRADRIGLISAGVIPKTTSGKIRRLETRRLHQLGELPPWQSA